VNEFLKKPKIPIDAKYGKVVAMDLDVSGLSTGSYQMKVNNGKATVVQRIVKL